MIWDLLCEWIAAGKTLRAFTREPGMPSPTELYSWNEEPAFKERLARARQAGYEAIAEESLAIVDDARNDWMETNDPKNPGYKLNGEHVQRSKLRAEHRLKLLACWTQAYNPAQRLQHSGQVSLETLVAGSYKPTAEDLTS